MIVYKVVTKFGIKNKIDKMFKSTTNTGNLAKQSDNQPYLPYTMWDYQGFQFNKKLTEFKHF